MPRALRVAAGGVVYHVLNRANARSALFSARADYEAFERVLEQAHERVPMRTLAYCVMPNHWHLVLWPVRDGDLSQFLRWLTLTHTQRWHAARDTTGSGHVYQGRFKSFPVQTDRHLLAVCRYVEANALRASLVERAEDWRWSSLWRRRFGDEQAKAILTDWPVDRPQSWLSVVNRSQVQRDVRTLHNCIQSGRPFGEDTWVKRMAGRLGLFATLRPRGRPQKKGPDTFSG